MEDQRYLVTARKYRPSLFKEVVAQGHVTDTLKNAIRLDRLAHAYLFSGPRGVGKTTAARILAKAINCETPKDEREDEAEPCCECDSCRSFEEGRSLNVFEMDAASNNKVDDIRELREKVRIPPQGDAKKVYILDEVHMLSKQAFNALLKTLEEPPPHALFIFATTEPHKVLPTILSRCQRFDFRRIPVPKIVGRLEEVCKTEGVEADEESLMLLARKGNGALRDALSAFDQALSLCGTTLEYRELTEALGVVDQDLYFRLTDHVATQDTAGMLELVRDVVRRGYDLQELLVGLAEHLRNLLVAHSLGGEAVEEVAESTQRRYAKECERFAEADLLRLLTMASEAEEDVKQSSQPRLMLETTLLKMAQVRRAADLGRVLEKIDRLEEMVESGELPETWPADGASGEETASSDGHDRGASSETDPPDSEREEVDAVEESDRGYRPESGSEPVSGDGSAGVEESTSEFVPPTETSEDDGEPDEEAAAAGGEEDGADEPGRGSGGTDGSAVEYDDLFGKPALDASEESDDDGRETENRALASSYAEPGDQSGGAATAVAEPDVEASTTAEVVAEEWTRVVHSVKKEHISLGPLLGESEPTDYVDGTLTITVPRALHRESLRDRRRVLVEHLSEHVDPPIEKLRFVVDASAAQEEPESSDESLTPRERLQKLRDTYPALDVLFGEFGAEPVW